MPSHVSVHTEPFAQPHAPGRTHAGGDDPERWVAEADAIIGTLVGERYQVLQRLGHGGMGAVYLARHTVLDSQVAIKVLLAAPDAASQERFLREAKLASKVSHPNTVYISDFGVLPGGQFYLVMELLRGKTLADELVGGPLSPARACQIALQIACGLEAVHEKGIIHRDLKPSNVFLVEQGGRVRPGGATDLVKIVDFGIAKQAESSDEEAAGRGRKPGKGKFEFALTAPGAVMGTPSYLSPEQARSEAVSAVADQYSLGCILYEMVTGAVPFTATGLIELLEKHISQPPPPLSTAERPTPKPVPRRLEALVQRLLAKEPKARFPSMREVASELEAILAELSAAARPPVRPPPLARGYRWAALAAAAALLVGGVVLVTRPQPQTAPARPPLSAAELASLHQRSLAALKEDLHSGQPMLRLGAVSALGQVRAREARPELAALLKDRDASVQALAAHALAQLGDPGGRQYLEQELAASSPERQLQAALLLCDQDSPIAQRQLWDSVQNNKVPEPVWLDAVTCLAQSSQPLLARAKLAERWRSLGSGAGQDAARIPVAARLVQLGDEGARSYLRGLVSPRRPGSAQLAAARALAAPDEPEAAALFRRVLGSQLAETAARLLASEGLGLSGDLLDLRLLSPALEPAVAPELRQAAAIAILRLWATDPAALSAESLTWARSALSDASWAMRVAAVEVLEGSPAPGAVALYFASAMALADGTRGEPCPATTGFLVGACGQIALALQRHALDQQTRSHLAVGRQHQHSVQLLRLQHVVLQHIRQAFEFFVMVAVQRHHALVGLLAWQAVLGVQRDGATPAAAHIDHLAQPGIGSDVAVDGGGSAQAEVRLHLRHRHLHRAIPEHLQHQRAVELDVGLHQHTSRSHLAQQLLHGCGIGAGGRIAVAALQDLGPGIGQPHDHAAHGQAFKQKLVEFRHSGIPEKQK